MSTPCPITTKFLEGLRETARSQQAEDLYGEIEELCSAAEDCVVSRPVLLLRGFYVVEVFYHVILPFMAGRTVLPRARPSKVSVATIAAAGKLSESLRALRYQRSREGLSLLLARLEPLNGDIELECYASNLETRIDVGIRNLRSAYFVKWREVHAHCLAAIGDLRSSLGSADVSWASFGAHLSAGFAKGDCAVDDALPHVQALLDTNLTVEVAPWSLSHR